MKRRSPRVCSASSRNATAPGHEPAGEQRQPEQQVQGDGAADHLGQVGGHRDELGLHPQPEDDRTAVRVRQFSGRLAPVARPSFADRLCTNIAMRLAETITQSSR